MSDEPMRIWWVALVVGGCAAAVATAMIARLLSRLRGPDRAAFGTLR